MPRAEYSEPSSLELFDGSVFTQVRTKRLNPRSPSEVARYFNLPDATENTLREYLRRKPDDEAAQTVKEIKKLYKKSSTIQKQLVDRVGYDGRIHPWFNQTFVKTGRLCVAEGTPVEVVRSDVSKHIPVQDVQPGDLVYAFDDDRRLVLKPVTWAGKTGRRSVVRVYWRGAGNKHSGHVDLTPNHPVRLVDGSYKPAGKLARFDRVLSLSRGLTNYGYHLLYATGHEPIKDHIFVYEQFNNPAENVHHKDRNKLNNSLGNLVGMTASDHTRLHGVSDWTPARRRAAREYARCRYNEIKDRLLANPRRLGLEKAWMIDVLWENAGKPTAFRDVYNIDYQTAKKYLDYHNIDWREIKSHFTSHGRLIDESFYAEVSERIEKHGVRGLRGTGVGYYRWKEIKNKFCNNHVILDVVELEDEVDVYDIEVQDVHNFIAGEVCIHNSSQEPNLQNQDRGSDVRGLFIPSPGNKFVISDYSQLELRLAAYFSRDKTMLEAYKSGRDLHTETQLNIFGSPEHKSKDEAKRDRTLSKNINFGLVYGGGAGVLIRFAAKSGVEITENEAVEYRNAFRDLYPGLVRWQERTGNTKPEYVRTFRGRRRYITPGEGYTTRINNIVQGTAADGMKLALVELYRVGLLPILNVHDEVLLEVPEETSEHVSVIVVQKMVDSMYRAAGIDPQNPVVPIEAEVDIANSWADKS